MWSATWHQNNVLWQAKHLLFFILFGPCRILREKSLQKLLFFTLFFIIDNIDLSLLCPLLCSNSDNVPGEDHTFTVFWASPTVMMMMIVPTSTTGSNNAERQMKRSLAVGVHGRDYVGGGVLQSGGDRNRPCGGLQRARAGRAGRCSFCFCHGHVGWAQYQKSFQVAAQGNNKIKEEW